jgi:hypothetical protein
MTVSIAAVVETVNGIQAVIENPSAGAQGPPGPPGSNAFAGNPIQLTGSGVQALMPTTGRNLVRITGLTGALQPQFPTAPSPGCSFLFKMGDLSMTVHTGAHTVQLLGNGAHVEFEGSLDAGGLNTGPVFGIDNFGAPGGGDIEYAYDGTDGVWLSL